MSELRGATDIGDFLVSARSFDEYRAMFALTDADLRGRVLDCPGGGASFTAAARARGADAFAVDPIYASRPRELVARLDASPRTCCSPTPTGSTPGSTSPPCARWPAWAPRCASTHWSTRPAGPCPTCSPPWWRSWAVRACRCGSETRNRG